MNRPSSAVLLAVSLLLSAAGSARAQSLQELYDAAHGYDASYLSARALADSARERVEQAEGAQRPQAALTGVANTSQVNAPTQDRTSINSNSASLNGRYPIFNRALSVTAEQSRRNLLSAAADVDAAEQDLIIRVSQAYFDVLAANDTLLTTRANKTAITEQLASAKRNFEVGTSTITDTREAQARFDLATAQEIAAENDLRTKRIALDQLVGRQNVVPKALVAAVLPAPLPSNVEDWVTSGEFQHPAVRRARVALDVASLEVEKARAGAMPTVDATAVVGAQKADGTFRNVYRDNTWSGGVGVTLNWPLYTGGAVQARVRETLLLQDKARNDLDAARRNVAQTARAAYFGVLSGLSQVRALEAAQSSSKLALDATQLGYKVGVRVNVDVLNSQSQLFQTERDLSKARYDVVMGTLRLRQAAGQLTEADVQAVNRLLAP